MVSSHCKSPLSFYASFTTGVSLVSVFSRHDFRGEYVFISFFRELRGVKTI